jgi:hypothetical protein
VSIVAIQHVKRMRGGAQAHLMLCSDNHFYVVKFLNNPQHRRVLANEFLATRLAEWAGLPVPVTEVVEVSKCLVKHTADLHIQLAHGTVPCQPGLQFASRYAVNPLTGQVLDYFPVAMLEQVRNVETFAGMLVVDKWTGNADGRQAAFWRRSRERKYTATFIDQGNCFNAGEWTFPDHPLRGVYSGNGVYAGVRGWHSFEPWLSRIEQMEKLVVWGLADEIPPEWYGGDWIALEKLISCLIVRQGIVRGLIEAFRHSVRNPFPDWHDRGANINPFSRLEIA